MRYEKSFIENIIKQYELGLNSTQLSKLYLVKEKTIGYWIRKYSTPRHKGPKSFIKNEDFFSKIDSEKKAYYLGWIMADGCVSTYANQYCLKLHIGFKDKILIDQFLFEIGSINKTKFKPSNGNGSYYVSLTSKKMVCDLIKHGVIERKTGKETIPSTIPKLLIPHFIRGYFDGDGITDIVQNRSGFISSIEFLTQLQVILNVNKKIISVNEKNTAYFLSGKKFSKLLYNYMYSNSNIHLTRKKYRLFKIQR